MTLADYMVAFLAMFVWALMLGIINMENKLYVLMFMWVWLTYMISSLTAVKYVFFIMTYALFATILVHNTELMCRRARLALVPPARRRFVAAAPAA